MRGFADDGSLEAEMGLLNTLYLFGAPNHPFLCSFLLTSFLITASRLLVSSVLFLQLAERVIGHSLPSARSYTLQSSLEPRLLALSSSLSSSLHHHLLLSPIERPATQRRRQNTKSSPSGEVTTVEPPDYRFVLIILDSSAPYLLFNASILSK